jgi:hypothetical protein
MNAIERRVAALERSAAAATPCATPEPFWSEAHGAMMENRRRPDFSDHPDARRMGTGRAETPGHAFRAGGATLRRSRTVKTAGSELKESPPQSFRETPMTPVTDLERREREERLDQQLYPATLPQKKVIVYDAQGKSYELDSVDAREYVASGSYTYEKEHEQ